MGCYRISAVAITIVLTSSVLGCAGQSEQTKKEIQGLQDRVAILQNERDRFDERLSALEQQQQILMSAAKASVVPAANETPPLRVVRLTPQDDAPAAPHQAAGDPGAPEAASGGRVLISGSGTELTATPVDEGGQ